jgi:hypothetical protein
MIVLLHLLHLPQDYLRRRLHRRLHLGIVLVAELLTAEIVRVNLTARLIGILDRRGILVMSLMILLDTGKEISVEEMIGVLHSGMTYAYSTTSAVQCRSSSRFLLHAGYRISHCHTDDPLPPMNLPQKIRTILTNQKRTILKRGLFLFLSSPRVSPRVIWVSFSKTNLVKAQSWIPE